MVLRARQRLNERRGGGGGGGGDKIKTLKRKYFFFLLTRVHTLHLISRAHCKTVGFDVRALCV